MIKMNFNLSGWYLGIISFNDKVLDLSVPEVRKKLTQKYLEECYDDCIGKIESLEDYFENKLAFRETLERIATTERAEVVAREVRYPPFWSSYPRRSKYFYVPHYIFEEKIKRIEIPNDKPEKLAKGSVYHETLHHFLHSYQRLTNSLLTDKIKIEKQKKRAEFFLEENVVELFTDLCLADDEEALFEHRWELYYLKHPGRRFMINMPIATVAGATIGYSIFHPQFFPVLLALYVINNRVHVAYKKSKRQELLQPKERPSLKFKI